MKITYPAPTVRRKITVNNFKEMDDITSENLLSLSTPASSGNIHIKGGKITTGLGITLAKFKFDNEEFTLNPAPERVLKQVFVYYNFNRDKNIEENYLIVRTAVGNFYKTPIKNNNQWEKIAGLSTQKQTEGINYRFNNKDVMLFSSSDMPLTMYDGTTVTTISQAPKLNSMAVHYGRVFVSTINEGDVWFSDDYNPLNWNVSLNEAGFVKFNDSLGKTVKVFSFRDYLYIFREYGIYRMQAIGSQQNFQLNLVTEVAGKIYKDSIVQVGNVIMFLTSEGMYIFDGFTLKKVRKPIKALENILEKGIVAGYYKNKYIVAIYNPDFEYEMGEEAFNNCVLSYDVLSNKLEMYSGFTINSLAPIRIRQTANCVLLQNSQQKGYILMLDYCGKDLNKALNSWFETINYSFGDLSKDKYIREIRIQSSYNCTIEAFTDNGIKRIKVPGSNKNISVKIMQKTKSLKLRFTFNGAVDFSQFEIIYDEVYNA